MDRGSQFCFTGCWEDQPLLFPLQQGLAAPGSWRRAPGAAGTWPVSGRLTLPGNQCLLNGVKMPD